MNNTTFKSFVSEARENDFVVIPLADKRPIPFEWQKRTDFNESEWEKATAIGLRCGKMTDEFAVVCIDIDTKEPDILRLVNDTIERRLNEAGIKAMKNSFYVEESRNGFHVVLLTTESRSGNRKLYYKDGKCLVETREEGGQVRIAPSAGNKAHNCLFDIEDIFDADIVEAVFSDLNNKPVAPTRPVALKETAMIATDNPADDLRQNPESLVRFLLCNTWTLLKEDSERWYVQRPGAMGSDNHSITIARNGGAVKVWSSNLVTSQEETVSPLTFIANEFYHGDCKVAGREWRVNVMTTNNETLSEEDKAMIERIAENMKKKENKAVSKENWDFSIEAAIMYGSAHKDEMKTSLPDAIYNSSSRIREMIDYISDKNDGCRIGSFAAAWTAAGMVCGRKVIEQHAQDNKVKQCSTAQYTFAFAPSGCGKSAGEGLIKMVCDEYNRPLYAIEKEREESESEAYEIAKHEWENADKASRGPAPKKPEKARWFKRMFNQAASSQALFEDLANRTDGKILVCVDEARDYLNAIADRYAKQYLSDIRTTYKKAFTSELGEIVNETSLSQRSKCNTSEYRIYHPSISTYYSGVSPASWDEYSDCVEDGTFGRFNFFFFDDDSENVIVCSNSREQRFNWKETSIKSWVRSWAMREDEQLVEWTDGALRMLAKFLMEVRTEKRKWASKNALFADCVAHSPLRFVKAALLYAVIDKDNDEDLRFARIDEEACRKAYTFMMYQFAMMMNVFNLAEGMQESDIIRTMREYTKSVCDDNGWFTVKALLASGFTWRGWNKNTAAGKLKTMSDNREGIEWNGKINKYTAFRIQTLEDED